MSTENHGQRIAALETAVICLMKNTFALQKADLMLIRLVLTGENVAIRKSKLSDFKADDEIQKQLTGISHVQQSENEITIEQVDEQLRQINDLLNNFGNAGSPPVPPASP
jgi:hypothetical protein